MTTPYHHLTANQDGEKSAFRASWHPKRAGWRDATPAEAAEIRRVARLGCGGRGRVERRGAGGAGGAGSGAGAGAGRPVPAGECLHPKC